MVYDLGGGTFDVSIIELYEGIVDVVATVGDNLLGGDDFDELLANKLADEFAKEHEIDLRADHQAWARLLCAAEDAKIELSDVQYTEVNLEYLAKGEKGRPLHLTREIRREEFEDLIENLLDRTIDAIDKALKDAKLEAEDIDRVLFVGGSTRIPAVWDLVKERMGQDPHTDINPDEAVALGAAVRGTRARVQQSLKADRQRMSPEQIAASQEKLAEWSEAELGELDAVEFDPGVMALFDRARKVLEQPNLNADLAEEFLP